MEFQRPPGLAGGRSFALGKPLALGVKQNLSPNFEGGHRTSKETFQKFVGFKGSPHFEKQFTCPMDGKGGNPAVCNKRRSICQNPSCPSILR